MSALELPASALSPNPRASVCMRNEEGRLVANLQDDVVKPVHFLRDFANIVTFAAGQIFMLKCLRVLVIAAAFGLHVVFKI